MVTVEEWTHGIKGPQYYCSRPFSIVKYVVYYDTKVAFETGDG